MLELQVMPERALATSQWELVLGMFCTPALYEVASTGGGLAQMVERSLSMREVPGSTPGFSILFFFTLAQL